MRLVGKSTGQRAVSASGLSKISLVLFLFACCLWTGLTALAQYSSPLAKNPVNDVFFLDSSRGWVLKGENRRAVLFQTTDGGNTWSRIDLEPPIYKIFFLNELHGWALAIDWPQPDAPQTSLYETKDGARSWSRKATVLVAESNRSAILFDLWFVNDNRGWFVGQGGDGSGLAFATEDGGHSVHPIDEIPTEDNILNRIRGAQKDKLWVFGRNSVTASFDGGRTWQSQLDSTKIPKGLGYVGLNSGIILRNGVGWAVGGGPGPLILATKNFGNTWNISFESSDGNRLDDISFWDGRHGCAVGASTTLYCTSDGGQHWDARGVLPKAVDPIASADGINVDNGFTRIVLLNSKRGWVLSEGGWLFQTDDAGATWHEADVGK